LDAVRDAVLEEELRAEDIDLVAHARLDTEMPDEGVVHDGSGPLGAEDVLHLTLAEIEDVHADLRRMVLPRRAVDAGEDVGAGEPPRDELALAAGDAGDEDLLPGARAAARGSCAGVDARRVGSRGAAGGAAPRRVYRAARHVAGRGYAGAAAVAQAVVERPDCAGRRRGAAAVPLTAWSGRRGVVHADGFRVRPSPSDRSHRGRPTR